jgi:hypothetical protein
MNVRARHTTKFAGGRMSPEEMHAKYAFPPSAKCAACGKRPQIRAIVMMELAEAKKNEALVRLMEFDPETFLAQLVQIKGSDGRATPYYRCSVTYACRSCSKAMQHQLAKAPSHCIVEINHGIGPQKIISS